MADQNQTVHTIFTGEANLDAARAELKALNNQFQAVMKQMAQAVEGVDKKTLATVRAYNKAMGTLQQAQGLVQNANNRPSLNLRRSVSDDRAATRAAQELAQAKTRLSTIEAELAGLDARAGGRSPVRISRLRQEREAVQQLVSQYEAVSAVVQKYERNYGRLTANALTRGSRETVSDARAYLAAQERIAGAKQRIEAHDAGRLRISNSEIATLRAEVQMTERLLRLHEQDANVMSRVQQLRDRSQRQQMQGAPDPQRRMGARADLMGDYAALGTAATAAYSLWDFAVKDESALAQFRAIAAASGSETARLAEDMRELGLNTKFTNIEIAQAATLLAQAGLSASDTGPALKAISELATAAGVELKQAADVVTSITNIWSYNVSQMGDVANVLTAALNQTKLGMDQIQLGVQYAGNTASDAGVDFVELTSIMGAMAQAGIRSGSTIGTGLRTLLTDLQNPTEKTIAALDRVGLSMADVDVRTLGLTQVLQNLKTAGFTSADAMGAFEIRAASAFSAISNNLDVVNDLQGSLYDTDATARANAIQMDTLAGRWNTLTNAGQNLAATGLQPVMAFLKELFQFGTSVLGMMSKLTPVVQGLTTALVVMLANFTISRFGLAIKALAGVALGLEATAAAATGAAVATTGFSTALRAVPIIGWIAAAAGLIVSLISLAGGFQDGKKEADLLEGSINDLGSQLMETETTIKAVDQATDRLRARQTALMTGTKEMRDQVLEQTRRRFESLGLQIDKGSDSVQDMIEALGRLREELNREFSSQLMDLADRLQAKIDDMNDRLSKGEVISNSQAEAGLTAYHQMRNRGVAMTDGQRRQQQLISGRVTLGEDYSVDQYRQDMQSLRDQEKSIRASRNGARPGSREYAMYDSQLEALTDFKLVMGSFNDFLGELARTQTQEQNTEMDADYQRALGRTQSVSGGEDPNDLTGTAAGVRRVIVGELQSFEPRVAAIVNSTASASVRAEQLEALKNDADSRMFEMMEQARPFVAMDPEMAPFIDRFFAELNEEVASLTQTFFRPMEATAAQGEREDKKTGRTGAQAENDQQDLDRRLSQAELDRLEARMEAIEARIKAGSEDGTLAAGELTTLRDEWMKLNQEREGAARTAERDRMRTSGMYDRRGGLEMPLRGGVNSEYSLNRRNPVTGEMRPHRGIDIDGATGDRVNTAGTGRVVSAGWQNGYGNTIEIEHANGIRTLYAHLSEMVVKVGDEVSRGQRIGSVGATGTATGPHLHFGVKRNGQWIDPPTALGQGGEAAEGDPSLNRLAALNWERFEEEGQKRVDDFSRMYQRALGEALFDPLERELKARREMNDATIDSILQGIKTGTVNTSLEEITAQLRAKVGDNLMIARELLLNDPENMNRRDTPAFQTEMAAAEIQVLKDGAQAIEEAYASFVALQERLGEERMAQTQNQLRIAGATAGTSETTTWLLNKRLEMEEYQMAVDILAASERAYNDVLLQRASIEAEVAKATVELQAATAAGDQAAIERVKENLLVAQEALTLIQQATNTAGVRVAEAQRAVTTAAPVGPTPTGAATATARGSQTPTEMLTAAIERYREQSGVMVDVSQTVADGIYGAFSSLGQGIEDTINQIADGSITIEGAFKNIFGGILKEMQGMAAKIAANWIMQYIMKMALNAMGIVMPGGADMGPIALPTGGSGAITGSPLSLGGTPRRLALGGGALGRDSIHALVEPGEITMRKSAVDFIGRESLLNLNAMGNRKLSAAGATIPPLAQPREPDMVNVWVVDRAQVPPPSKKDIVHVVGESITSGELKKLVKQVAVGG